MYFTDKFTEEELKQYELFKKFMIAYENEKRYNYYMHCEKMKEI